MDLYFVYLGHISNICYQVSSESLQITHNGDITYLPLMNKVAKAAVASARCLNI